MIESRSQKNYVVLARKWRSSQFSDVVGQSHIVRTLMNAIRSERIHQAYLFTGSRGIGKTSIARIFAKVIRCEATSSARGTDDVDWLQSCDACASCREIASGTSVDVIEIDGASNNGVDAVREIRESAKYLPATGRRKIYIIDEVHMLTTAAFNALLKTLEEPPAHVIFIFATTEPQKIPATILSRCQRFDFRRHTVAQIQSRLARIAESEGIRAESGGLALIARAAEGSMRDGLSLLDQVIAFSGSSLTTQSVRESVGLIEGQTLLGIASAVFGRKPLDAVALVDQAYQQGHDLRVLTRSLIELLHGAILFKVGATHSALLELSDEEAQELRSLVQLRSLEEIELIFQVLHHGLEWIARSPQPKVVLDVLLIKCASAETLVHASSANPVATPAATSGSGSSVPTPPQDPQTSTAAAAPKPAAQEAPNVPSWEGFIEHVRKSRPLLASLLENAICGMLPGESDPRLVLRFGPQDAYYRDQLHSRAYQEQMSALTKEYFRRFVKVQIELKEGGESLAARKDRELKERHAAARMAAQNHPMILEAKSLFGGELGPIELTERSEESDEGDATAGSGGFGRA